MAKQLVNLTKDAKGMYYELRGRGNKPEKDEVTFHVKTVTDGKLFFVRLDFSDDIDIFYEVEI